MDTFSSFHPLINFIFFAFAIGIPLFYLHPVLCGISLAAGCLYMVWLRGIKSLRTALFGMLPLCALTAIINPLFSHQGQTILYYFSNGNPLTLESIRYGLAAGLMFAGVLAWFSCFHKIMTADKFMYLFGRSIPGISLLLSMTLRFVPRFQGQIKRIRRAQECIGRDLTNGSPMQKLGHALTIFSIAVTWALENSVETADSMKSRGYGLRGRTNYSIYRFDGRDGALLVLLAALLALIFSAIGAKWIHIRFYPLFSMEGIGGKGLAIYAFYAVFCLLPLLLDLWDALRWKQRLGKNVRLAQTAETKKKARPARTDKHANIAFDEKSP